MSNPIKFTSTHYEETETMDTPINTNDYIKEENTMKNTLQINKPVTGVYADSAFGGIEILGDIEYGITDYVYWRFNYGTPENVHKTKIYYNGNPHFRTSSGKRIYLKDIQRVQW